MRTDAMKTGACAVCLVLTALASGCAWVKPSVSGSAVRVAYDGNVGGCRDAGAVSVSVADKVGFYHRPELKVRDELETLARNEAAGLPADTIVAKDEPHDGAQHFEAYVCGAVRVHQREPARHEGAETFPIKDH